MLLCELESDELFSAVKNNNLERVKVLVEQGADKNKSFGCHTHGDFCCYTPLMIAADYSTLNVLRYFVEQGADVEQACCAGNTPLMVATSKGRFEVARYLLEQGADRDRTNNFGNTSLHQAAAGGSSCYLKIAKLLMSYGADLNAENDYGDLPIDRAWTAEMRQAILDEPRRRSDEAPGKRATEQDRHPNAATSSSAQQEDVAQVEKSVVDNEEGEVADEDQDSETSSDEEDGNRRRLFAVRLMLLT